MHTWKTDIFNVFLSWKIINITIFYQIFTYFAIFSLNVTKCEITDVIQRKERRTRFNIQNGGGLVTNSPLTLFDPMDCSPPVPSVLGVFPGKNTGMGCHFLLQGIYPTRRLNSGLLCLLHWQAGSLPTEPQGDHLQFCKVGLVDYKIHNTLTTLWQV